MYPIAAPSPTSGPEPRRRHRVRTWLIAGAVVAVVAVIAAMGVTWLQYKTRPVPQFASLAAAPDTALHGTVAYVLGGCVSVVAAAGAPTRQLLCLPEQDGSKMVELGKETGPQLVWLPDGRLEVTMFRFNGAPPYRAGWQKVVDVRTGTVTDTPAAKVPSQLNLGTRPTVSPSGEQVLFTSDRGEVSVSLGTSTGTRTLLSAQGPPDGYGISSAFWSPDYRWIAAEDGRVLVITPADGVTRVLVDAADTAFGDDPATARFAITSQDLLTK